MGGGGGSKPTSYYPGRRRNIDDLGPASDHDHAVDIANFHHRGRGMHLDESGTAGRYEDAAAAEAFLRQVPAGVGLVVIVLDVVVVLVRVSTSTNITYLGNLLGSRLLCRCVPLRRKGRGQQRRRWW